MKSNSFRGYYRYDSGPNNETPEIMIGNYFVNGGTTGEFRIEFTEIGVKLEAFNDSWKTLLSFTDLMDFMKSMKSEEETEGIDIDGFCKELDIMGYIDCRFTSKDLIEKIVHSRHRNDIIDSILK